MKPTEVLVEEHNVIKVMLQVVEEISRRLESGKSVSDRDLEKVVDFIQGFADACHHRKEEGVLFPAMEEAGVPRQGGPIGVMLSEHELGRTYVGKMKEAASDIEGSVSVKLFTENVRSYINLLRQHIDKEDTILYPMAEKRISKDDMIRLSEEFERVEREETGEGVHEKYHEMVHELRDKYLIN